MVDVRKFHIYAGRVTPGMTIETIPSIASGRRTITTVVVASVEKFTINGHNFVDLNGSNGVSLTVSTDTIVNTLG